MVPVVIPNSTSIAYNMVGRKDPLIDTSLVNGAHESNGACSKDANVFDYPNHCLGKPKPIRIILIGAGVTGIAAVKIFREVFKDGTVELVIYEKNHDVTGTWLENRYPG